MQTHNIVVSIMALNFVFWITFGTLSFFLYIYLVTKVFSYDMRKELLEKYIRIFSVLSIFPSITLIAILTLSVFYVHTLWIFIVFIYSGFPLAMLVIAWIMPPIFLMIKPFISKKSYFYKFFVAWFGMVSFCLFLPIFAFFER